VIGGGDMSDFLAATSTWLSGDTSSSSTEMHHHENNYNLTIHSNASQENVVASYAMLKAMNGDS
jgi:hypothetical protein